MFIILLVAFFGLMISYGLEYFRIIKTLRKDMMTTLSLETKMVGHYSVTALLFDDQAGAEEILAKLENIPHVLAVNLYNAENGLFASYGTIPREMEALNVQHETGAQRIGPFIIVNEPVIYKDIAYGRVYLIASAEPLKDRIRSHFMGIPFMVLILLIFLGIMGFWFQRIISQPILNLAKITSDIAKSNDYSIRIETSGKDEIGLLYHSFNTLLEKITLRERERDEALQGLKLEQQNLESRVEERTRELEAAKNRAEDSDRLKSAFLANMSHEIRTPLNAILGFASVLTKNNLPREKQQQYHKFIAASGDDLLNLVNDILDIAKIEANQLDIHLDNVPLNGLLEQLIETLKQSLRVYGKKDKVDVRLNIPDWEQEYIMYTDELRLKQILTNLGHNAIKFTDKGSIEIGYTETEENKLILYVKDTGIGMPADKLDSIFDRFVKIDSSEQKLYKGSGLGLSIAQRLAGLLGAQLSVESELKKGTVFYIEIPYQIRINGHLQEKDPVPQRFMENINLDNFRILVAEDNEANYLLLRETIRTFSEAEILWAHNGKEAVDYCRSEPGIGLVLMDILMPVMKGDEATRQIKAFRKDLPIIAQTAHASEQDVKMFLKAGCDDVIKKPIDVDELLSKIQYYKNRKTPSGSENAA